MNPSKSAYNTVPVADEHSGSRSSTEVDESLMRDEKQWHSIELGNMERRRRKGWLSYLKTYRWLINTGLQLAILLLLVILLFRADGPSVLQVGGGYTDSGRTLTTKVVKWEADMSFVPSNTTEFFSNETLARWNTLMPAGTGRDLTSESFSTTSMTHQLHCLFMMGRIYAGITSNTTERLPNEYGRHFLHCIDYLRQAIMCSADLALEIHGPNDADDLGPLDGGWNGRHVCKDYGEVLGYLDEQIASGRRTVLPIDD